MNISKKYILLLILVAVITAIGLLYVNSTAWLNPSSVELQVDPFYRSEEQLSTDGVTLITLTDEQKNAVKADIYMYYDTTYREDQIQELDPSSVKRIEDIRSAEAQILEYSKPRVYEELPNIVGVLAKGQLYDDERGTIGYPSSKLFFFRIDDAIELERVLDVGEDNATYESATVEFFRLEQ